MFQSIKSKVQTIAKTNNAKQVKSIDEELMEGWTHIGGEKLQQHVEVRVQFAEDRSHVESLGLFGPVPASLLLHLLSFLEDYDICQLAITSSSMCEAANSESLWERLYIKEFVNNKLIPKPSNINDNNDKKKAKLDYVTWNNQQGCGGYKALYGTQYCEQRLVNTLLALKDSNTPATNVGKLDWICKPLVTAHNFFVATEIRTLMVGLKTVGKTSILHKMAHGGLVPTSPTIGYNNSEKVTRGDFNFEIWDLEFQQENPLAAWKAYSKHVGALIFVIDCADHKSVNIAKIVFQMLVKDKTMGSLPLLVYANKRDLPGAMTTLQVITNLGLHKLVNKRGWHVQACSVVDDGNHGLWEGLDWLISTFNAEEVEKLQTKMRNL